MCANPVMVCKSRLIGYRAAGKNSQMEGNDSWPKKAQKRLPNPAGRDGKLPLKQNVELGLPHHENCWERLKRLDNKGIRMYRY